MNALARLEVPQNIDVLRASSALDDCIFGVDESVCYELPLEQQRSLRREFIRENFEHHWNECPQYRAFVSRMPGNESLDLDHVPLIPTVAFKRQAPLSISGTDVAKWCTSSGTRGAKSVVGRDRLTLERLLGSVRAGLGLVEHWYEHELHIVNLGPDRREAGDVWFSYVMSLVELSFPTTHEMTLGQIDYSKCLADVRNGLEKYPQAGIVGPPFRVLELMQYMTLRGQRIQGGNRLTVVTAGGWKRASGAAVSREELVQRMCEVFSLDSAAQYRDVFNQVELNTVFFECKAHRKHVPPWVYARARDPRTLAVVPYGEPGLLSFLDASSTSYPAFIVGDDVGVVEEGQCPCGREGVFVRIERRVAGRSARGCALAMEERADGNSI